mgnify:CR=1 FL=1
MLTCLHSLLGTNHPQVFPDSRRESREEGVAREGNGEGRVRRDRKDREGTKEETRTVFSEEDYLSGDGMQTSIFGPVLWTGIHMISFNYPVSPSLERKEAHADWILSLGKVLPCKHCRDNFESNMREAGWVFSSPPSDQSCLRGRDSFSRFCYDFHNVVNRALGKGEYELSFEEVRDRYEAFRSRCVSSSSSSSSSHPHAGKEKGCVDPKYEGTKGRCLLHIVPRSGGEEEGEEGEEGEEEGESFPPSSRGEGLIVDERCRIR